MKRIFILISFLLSAVQASFGQITVSPNSLTAYSQGATSAYLTFNNVVDRRPAEAMWCGEIMPATPAVGVRCDPATIFGVLPVRYDQSRLVGTRYTDIMSVTPAVARRAYTDAVSGNDSRFFYVRRFISTVGGPDEFVAVTIRLGGNTAGVPFSLTNVKLLWQGGERVVPFIKPDENLPKITAEIRYTGTGRLKGRWEIVKPGEQLPTQRDLLSEAALSPEERGTQRRYTLLNRFNINLPSGGRYILPGPENWRIDKTIEGMYLVLFRVEVSDAGNSFSDAGTATVPTGGVAGFPMPVLRYYVGNSGNLDVGSPTDFDAGPVPARRPPPVVKWDPVENAKLYLIEIVDEDGKTIFSAFVSPVTAAYRLPSFISELLPAKRLRWRSLAVDPKGETREIAGFTEIKNDS